MLYNRICIQCDKDYVSTTYNQRFCSVQCKKEYKTMRSHNKDNKKQHLLATMKCAECEKEFSLEERKGIFCSSICEQKFRNRQSIIQKRKVSNNNNNNALINSSVKLHSKICKYCKRKYLSRDIENNFCNERCLHKYIDQERNPKIGQRQLFVNKCKVCGAEFDTSYPDAKYCSRECQRIIIKSKELAIKKLGMERKEWIELFVEQMINKAISGGVVNQNGAYINYYHIEGFNNTIKTKILDRDYYECVLCKSKRSLHIHHIIPRQFGGSHNENNLVTLCARCHGAVETRDIQYAKRKCVENALLNIDSKTITIDKLGNMVIYNYINSFLLAVLNEDIILNEDAKKKVIEECSDILDNIDKIYN